ncbi:unnamed protein product [[Candida] boidinii]|uniref:Unnamed protein product n=1 Tax=Candida boidinii TaxID=5477 RepID=A0ACB5TSM1_CANBO|nr:unnamed protein product [[Candida] boidinii]
MLKLNLYFIFSILLVQGAFATESLPSDFKDIQVADENIDTSIHKREEQIEEKRNLSPTVVTSYPVILTSSQAACPATPTKFDKLFDSGYNFDIYDESSNLLKATYSYNYFSYYYSGLATKTTHKWGIDFNPVKFHAKLSFFFKPPKTGFFSFNTIFSDNFVIGIGAAKDNCCHYVKEDAKIYGHDNPNDISLLYPTVVYLEKDTIYPFEVTFNALGTLTQKLEFKIKDAGDGDMGCYMYRLKQEWCGPTPSTLPSTTSEKVPVTSSSSTIFITNMPSPTVSGYYDTAKEEPCFVLDLPKEWVDFQLEEQKGNGYVWNDEFYFTADGTTVPSADYTLSADQSTVLFAYSSVFSTQAAFTACGSVTERTNVYNAVYTVVGKYGSVVVKRDGSEETVLADTTTTVTLTPVVTDTKYIESIAASETSATSVAKRDDAPVVEIINNKKVIKMNPVVVLDPNYKEDKREAEPEAFEGAASALTLSKLVLASSFGIALLL